MQRLLSQQLFLFSNILWEGAKFSSVELEAAPAPFPSYDYM